MYEPRPAAFRTPRGNPVASMVRDGTNDWNTQNSCLTEDEYGLRGLPPLEGWALDIGGYLGGVALALAIDNPSLRVAVVEPVPDNAALIRENLRLNGLGRDSVELIEGAAAAPGVHRVEIGYAYQGSETDLVHAFVGNGTLNSGPHKSVHAVGWDLEALLRFTREDELPLAKIDCEGGEWGLLQSPLVDRVALWVGELHAVDGHRPRDVEALLPGFDVTYQFPVPGVGPDDEVTCGFRAVRR